MIKFAVLLSTVACVLGAAVPEFIFPQLDGRIVGGDPTTIDTFPWQVSIEVDGRHMCGGSIIDHNHILTAGHCILSYISINNYSVRAGSTYANTGGSVHEIDSVTVHEKFNPFNLENDISIMKLATPVEYNDNVKPISLGTISPAHGAEAAVSGWGYTSEEETSPPDQLRYVLVNIISNQKCGSDYGYKNRIKDSMVCAMAEGKDACQGDSGGPLERNGKLIGIVSWGTGCALPKYPGVYTDVAKFLDWVNKNIKM